MNSQEMKTARSFILFACAAAIAGAEPVAEKAATPPAMAWIPGGTFLMGTDEKESFPNEGLPTSFRSRVFGWMCTM